MGGRHPIAVVVRGDDAHVVAPGDETGGDILDEDEPRALLGRRSVGISRCERVGRDGHDDAGALREHGGDLHRLPIRTEAGLRHGDDLDTKPGALGPHPLDLCLRQGAGVMPDDRRGPAQLLEPFPLGPGELDVRGRRRRFAVWARAPDRVLGQSEQDERLVGLDAWL